MTWALCLNCGDTKFGAICPCPRCSQASSGDMGLDIIFSDHYMSHDTLKQLGSVIQEINRHTEDPSERFWCFIYFVSTRHPDILQVKLKDEAATRIPTLVDAMTLPQVEVKPGFKNRGEDDQMRDTSDRSPPRKHWWQFWRRE